MAEYTVTLLENVLGAPGVRALAINNKGQITGQAQVPGGHYHAFVYEGGDTTDLGVLPGGKNSFGTDINDAGEVCGLSEMTTAPHAFLWKNGVMKDLGTLGGHESWAYALNGAGEVVGWSDNAKAMRAFRWSNGVMHDLGVEGAYSTATGINESGQIVGVGGSFSFLYSGGSVTELPPSCDGAWGIDNAGEVVGGSQAFFRDAMGNVVLAPNVAGYSYAVALNAAHRAVGAVEVTFESYYAFRWDVGSQQLEDLNDLIDPLDDSDSLSWAHDINAAGQIVGETTKGLGFLLTPKKYELDVGRHLAYVRILAGIIGGGGGIVFTPSGGIGKVPDPVDPWQRLAWDAMTPAKRDLLLALAIDEVAGLVGNDRARRDLQKAARTLLKSSAGVAARIAPAPAARIARAPAVTRAGEQAMRRLFKKFSH